MKNICQNCKFFKKYNPVFINYFKSINEEYDDELNICSSKEESIDDIDTFLETNHPNFVFEKTVEKLSDFGECINSKFIYSSINCHNINLLKGNELLYIDYESYGAGFSVGKNFGCIHFKS